MPQTQISYIPKEEIYEKPRGWNEEGSFTPYKDFKEDEIWDDSLIESEEICAIAVAGGSFSFLLDPGEDIYTEADGDPIE